MVLHQGSCSGAYWGGTPWNCEITIKVCLTVFLSGDRFGVLGIQVTVRATD